MVGPDLNFLNPVEPMQVDLTEDQNENNAEVQQEEDFVVENSTLDLESYINSYTGTARLLRLVHIADHCPAMRIEALKMAIAHVYKTMNVAMYQQLHKKLHDTVSPQLPDIAGGGGAAVVDVLKVDPKWIEQTTKKAAIMLDKLDTDLKNYKSNSIKESIRRGYDDLGEYYLECGDLLSSLKSFSRAREYCTSAKHVISMCLNVIKVSVYLQNWSHVSSFVTKAENTPDPSEEKKVSEFNWGWDYPITNNYVSFNGREYVYPQTNNTKEITQTNSKLRCAAGLAELATKKYKSAAKYFLQVNFDHCDCTDIISPNNVAVYAGLCALATFDRNELQEKIISSSSFKLFLELEPQVRDVLISFHESKYAKCLQLLDEMKENLLLDIYLAPHVKLLYFQIRNRGLVQYFRPYASADMHRMAQSFNTSVALLENELMSLILDGQIQARIDSHNKILYVKDVDERCFTFEKSLKMGLEYERRTKLMILRSAILQAHIQVKNPVKDGQGDPASNSNFRGHRERSNS